MLFCQQHQEEKALGPGGQPLGGFFGGRGGSGPGSVHLDHGRGPFLNHDFELKLIQPHMAQKQVLRGEEGARALRVR